MQHFLKDGNRTSNSADGGTHLEPSSLLYNVRGFLRLNNVHRCNSGGWLMSLKCRVLCYVSVLYIMLCCSALYYVMLQCFILSASKPHVLFIVTHNVILYYLNTQKCFRNLLSCFVFALPWKVVTDGMVFPVYVPLQYFIQYNFSKLILWRHSKKG
jgi:hypothetical protein